MDYKTILVVDDETEILAYLGDILRRARFNVITTSKGIEAVELARSQSPNLILLDVVMPDMPGEDVADILAKDPSTSDIPIVFLTGIVTKEEEPLAKKIGGRYLLSKPITQRELLAVIGKILK